MQNVLVPIEPPEGVIECVRSEIISRFRDGWTRMEGPRDTDETRAVYAALIKAASESPALSEDAENILGAAWVEFDESTETVPRSLALRAINLAMAQALLPRCCPECHEKDLRCAVCGAALVGQSE